MQWTKPDFQEICLGMEVTAYANTDDRDDPQPIARTEASAPDRDGAEEKSL